VWLLQIDLGELATSMVAGKIMQVITVLTLTTVSAAIYTKSLKMLLNQLGKTRRWLVPIKLVMWWAATELFVSWEYNLVRSWSTS
jgi:hypothetical protein